MCPVSRVRGCSPGAPREGPSALIITRFRRPPEQGQTSTGEGTAGDGVVGRRRGRRVLAWAMTTLACLFVLFALIAPNDVSRFTPGAFVRIPLEGLLGVALILVLPKRAKRPAA